MNPFGTNPFGDFERLFDQARQEMGKRQRRFERLAVMWVAFIMAVVGFACWCVYHVLKAKRLVP